MFDQARDIFLNTITLGVSTLKNDVYKEIARGFHEGPSLALLSIILVGSSGMMVGLLCSIKTRDIIRKHVDQEGKKKIFPIIAISYVLFVLSLSFGYTIRARYINDAIAHFQQVAKIVSPYTPVEQQLEFASQFSQIESRNDYLKIVNKCREIARSRNLRLPKFDIW